MLDAASPFILASRNRTHRFGEQKIAVTDEGTLVAKTMERKAKTLQKRHQIYSSVLYSFFIVDEPSSYKSWQKLNHQCSSRTCNVCVLGVVHQTSPCHSYRSVSPQRYTGKNNDKALTNDKKMLKSWSLASHEGATVGCESNDHDAVCVNQERE